mmetsp:Transcript_10778/g.25397  ORF Transcript_10778/g.25397 Transcript_10778/m.25397 type:complete len:213 (+) Transcript_10778:724-1362(+)
MHGRGRGVRVRRGGDFRRRRRAHHRPRLRVGAVRHPLPAALLPLRRHGEPMPHLRHPDAARRGPLARRRRGARGEPLLDGQPDHQPHVGALLAQRGLDRVARAQDQGPHEGGGALRLQRNLRCEAPRRRRRALRRDQPAHAHGAAAARRRPGRRLLLGAVREGLQPAPLPLDGRRRRRGLRGLRARLRGPLQVQDTHERRLPRLLHGVVPRA